MTTPVAGWQSSMHLTTSSPPTPPPPTCDNSQLTQGRSQVWPVGMDPEIECECPRLVGLEWVPAPGRPVWNSEEAVQALKAEVADL